MSNNMQFIEEMYELTDRTVEAILLNFQDQIPDPGKITKAACIAVREYCDIDTSKGAPEFNETNIGWHYLNAGRLMPKVRGGLSEAIDHGQYEMSDLEFYMMDNKGITIDSETRFIDRQEIQEKVNSYWKKEELEDFKKISELVVNYI